MHRWSPRTAYISSICVSNLLLLKLFVFPGKLLWVKRPVLICRSGALRSASAKYATSVPETQNLGSGLSVTYMARCCYYSDSTRFHSLSLNRSFTRNSKSKPNRNGSATKIWATYSHTSDGVHINTEGTTGVHREQSAAAELNRGQKQICRWWVPQMTFHSSLEKEVQKGVRLAFSESSLGCVSGVESSAAAGPVHPPARRQRCDAQAAKPSKKQEGETGSGSFGLAWDLRQDCLVPGQHIPVTVDVQVRHCQRLCHIPVWLNIQGKMAQDSFLLFLPGSLRTRLGCRCGSTTLSVWPPAV